MDEGFTPLEEIEFDGSRVLIKIDYLFPTGSYKDRGATVLISKMKEWGVQKADIGGDPGNG
jgi:threonine synthase